MTPTTTDLDSLTRRLSDRDRSILTTVAELKLMRADQIERQFFHGQTSAGSGARHCRRTLAGLRELSVLARLERRIGGVRAGSSGHLYTLAPAGRRLLAQWNGDERPSSRGVHEPGLRFVEHTLEISELHTRLHEAHRHGTIELLAFEPEPASWRSYTLATGAAGTLKPDAFVRLGAGEWEERCFIEVDLATEGRGALARKTRAYADYYKTGREQATDGVFPRVVWLTTTGKRTRLIQAVADAHAPIAGLFAVGLLDDAVQTLSGGAASGVRP
jgi:hypothetical protein